jgi:lysine biosynthesis protein LysW
MDRKTKCPVCGEGFEIEDGLSIGDMTDCPGCYVELKIVKFDPVRVEEIIESSDDYGAGEDYE